MSEFSPPVRALLEGSSDVADRELTCCVCGEKASCPGFIIASVRLWNEEEIRLATVAGRRADLIRPSQMGITCGPGTSCAATEHERRREEYVRDNETTQAYLSMLRAGNYNPESLQWLRTHGLGKDVSRILASTGTTGSTTKAKTK